MFSHRTAVLLALLLLPGPLLTAQTGEILVPAEHPTIQLAIDAASGGDVIVVSPGLYPENLDYLGKDISVVSSDGPEATIIEGSQGNSVVAFVNGESPDALLEGFTITGGTGLVAPNDIAYGGGIRCQESSPTIRNCIITGNGEFASSTGGGVYLLNYSGLIESCEISDNESVGGGGIAAAGGEFLVQDCIIRKNHGGSGGGVSMFNVRARFEFCTLHENVASGGGGGMAFTLPGSGTFIEIANCRITSNTVLFPNDGGGIWGGALAGDVIITNTILANNHAGIGGGIFEACGGFVLTHCILYGNNASSSGGAVSMCSASTNSITNCIFWDNTSPDAPQISVVLGPDPEVTFCNIQGGWPGFQNIDADPAFRDPQAGDFHLLHSSPCIDAGTDSAPELPGTDFEGDPRIVGTGPDLGVDEITCLPPDCEPFVRGDVNVDQDVALTDVVFLVNAMFVPGSALPSCAAGADVNDDDSINLADPVALVVFLFLPGNPAPAPPFPHCGADPTPGSFFCASYGVCP